ncbi:MAG: Fur family transcriptional regulator [Acidimicrobiales bacterium]
MRSPEELTELFRANGRKVTAQRQCIFGLLEGDVTHPSAETVHDRASRIIGTISLKTVYQTLNDLAELGEIALLDLGTGTTRFDPNVDDHHHHLVCRRCGNVRDLVAAFPDPTIPAGAELGFDVGSAEIVFRGLCPACQAAPGSPVSRGHRRPMSTQDRIDETVTTVTTDERNGTPCQH